ALGSDAPGALRDILASQVQELAKKQVKEAKNMDFAFDIDGVLLHGDQIIPESRRALAEITRPSWLMLVVRVSRHMPPQRSTDSKTSSSPRTSSPGTPAFRNFSEEDHNQAKPQDPDRINFDAILVLQRLACFRYRSPGHQ
ncbi:hypothetical protein ACO22_07949, partial [Paracoccidioides brasiliensis]